MSIWHILEIPAKNQSGTKPPILSVVVPRNEHPVMGPESLSVNQLNASMDNNSHGGSRDVWASGRETRWSSQDWMVFNPFVSWLDIPPSDFFAT